MRLCAILCHQEHLCKSVPRRGMQAHYTQAHSSFPSLKVHSDLDLKEGINGGKRIRIDNFCSLSVVHILFSFAPYFFSPVPLNFLLRTSILLFLLSIWWISDQNIGGFQCFCVFFCGLRRSISQKIQCFCTLLRQCYFFYTVA